MRDAEVMDGDWTCAHCGEAIGVFELLIVLDGSRERQTSRAAEPELEYVEGRRYHRICSRAYRARPWRPGV
jgi:hypothetical protein